MIFCSIEQRWSITSSSRGNAPGNTRGKVRLVLDLYKSGLTPKEIAIRVYGGDSRKYRMRVHRIVYLYGKRMGLLSENKNVKDDVRGETIGSDGLVVRERGLGDSFITHSRPVTQSNPFLGAYRNIRQLKASLKREDVRAVNVMSYVDRFLGPLNLSHESMVREDAMYLARRFSGAGPDKVVAGASAFVSVLRRRPGDLPLLLEVLEVNDVDVLSVGLLARMLAITYG